MTGSPDVGRLEEVGSPRARSLDVFPQVLSDLSLTCGYVHGLEIERDRFQPFQPSNIVPTGRMLDGRQHPGDEADAAPDTTPPAKPSAGYSPRREGRGSTPSPIEADPEEACASGCVRVWESCGDRP